MDQPLSSSQSAPAALDGRLGGVGLRAAMLPHVPRPQTHHPQQVIRDAVGLMPRAGELARHSSVEERRRRQVADRAAADAEQAAAVAGAELVATHAQIAAARTASGGLPMGLPHRSASAPLSKQASKPTWAQALLQAGSSTPSSPPSTSAAAAAFSSGVTVFDVGPIWRGGDAAARAAAWVGSNRPGEGFVFNGCWWSDGGTSYCQFTRPAAVGKRPSRPAWVTATMEAELENKEMTLGMLMAEGSQTAQRLAPLTAEVRLLRAAVEAAGSPGQSGGRRPEHGDQVMYSNAFGVPGLTHHGIYCGRSPGFPEGSVIQYSAGAEKVDLSKGVEHNLQVMDQAAVVRTPWGRWTKDGQRAWEVVPAANGSKAAAGRGGARERSREQVVYEAANRLGESQYHVLKYNCEHFATECKTGRPTSRNVQNSVAVAATVGAAVAVAGVGLAAAAAVVAGGGGVAVAGVATTATAVAGVAASGLYPRAHRDGGPAPVVTVAAAAVHAAAEV